MSDISELGAVMLAWLAREPERLRRFCMATGYDEASLKEDLGGEALGLAVMEHVLGDESLLMQFCAETGTPPEQPMRVWQRTQGET